MATTESIWRLRRRAATAAIAVMATLAALAAPAAADTVRPSVPRGLSASITPSGASLSWNEATDDVAVAGYQIYVADSATEKGTQIASSDTTSYLDPAPIIGSWYYVRAVDTSGNVGWRTGSVQLLDAATDTERPTKPTGLQVARSNGTNTLQWNEGADNVAVSGYDVFLASGPTTLGELVGFTATTSFTHATADSAVWYYLKTVDSSQNRSWRTGSVKPVDANLDTTRPGRPSAMIVTAIGPTEVGLSWLAATDDVAVSGYNIYRSTVADAASAVLVGTTPALNYVDTSADPGTKYWYYLRTVDTSGNLSWRTGLRTATTATTAAINVVAAGDLRTCNTTEGIKTAQLLSLLPGDFIGLGDFVYPTGTIEAFNECYDPVFGPFKQRTLPVPGNHEYYDPGAAGYYGYFGAEKAGPPGTPWYTVERGNWQLIALDSNCFEVNQCDIGSAQYEWLEAVLEAAPGMCRVAAMHHPYQSSFSAYDDAAYLTPMLQLLIDHGTDIVLAGHAHHYERFAQQTLDHVPDTETGYTQFTVGTGGGPLRATDSVAVNSLVRNSHDHGLLDLDLLDDGYQFRFLRTDGSTADAGGDGCVNA